MNVNQGDGADLYGEVQGIALSAESSPHSREWDGRDSGLVISDIGAPGETIAFTVGGTAPAQVIVGQASPMLTIPDNRATGVSSVIAIAESGTVAKIRVRIDIEHPYIGDLRVTLTSPGGRRAVLHAELGGPTDNLIAAYDSTSPGTLSSMVGQSMKGDWVLNVADRARRDVGTLRSWSIELRSAPVGVSREIHTSELERKVGKRKAGIRKAG
jgi:subtilisin-like proprotein convertase family protein